MEKVIFRKFKDTGEIIAFFPDSKEKFETMSYMRIGQHGMSDYQGLLSVTKLATKKEYKPLLNELKSIGYEDLKVYKKLI